MKTDLILAIREVSSSPSTRKSKIGRIRELLDEIERAQQAGVHLADISTALSDHGFEGMNLKCLQNLLYQARKKKSGNEKHQKSKLDTLPVKPNQRGTSAGIDADSIFEVARNSMKSKTASNITLGLLRSQKSTNERNPK